MKIGAENRTKVIAAVVLAVVAVLVIIGQFSGLLGGFSSSAAAPSPSASTTAASDPVPARTAPARHAVTGKKNAQESSLDPSLRLDLLKSSEDTKYEGTGRNIFMVFVPPPPRPVAPVVVGKNVAPTAPPVITQPPPPPINLVFYGFATPTGGSKRVFLAKGEDIFVAKEGDIVDRRYKVVRISATAVEILDVLSNNRQSIPLTQG